MQRVRQHAMNGEWSAGARALAECVDAGLLAKMYRLYQQPESSSFACRLYAPADLVPPHRVTRPEQVDDLAVDMQTRGWVGDPLVGYPDETIRTAPIQLLSGTHRRAAAERVGIPVPVVVRTFAEVVAAWGDLDLWQKLMTP